MGREWGRVVLGMPQHTARRTKGSKLNCLFVLPCFSRRAPVGKGETAPTTELLLVGKGKSYNRLTA